MLKIGRKVKCIDPRDTPLKQDNIYTISRLSKCGKGIRHFYEMFYKKTNVTHLNMIDKTISCF